MIHSTTFSNNTPFRATVQTTFDRLLNRPYFAGNNVHFGSVDSYAVAPKFRAHTETVQQRDTSMPHHMLNLLA
jgi:hypothetical protein